MGMKKKEDTMENTKVEETKVEDTKVTFEAVQNEKIRNLTSGVDDIQKLRIATGNRIVQSFNIQMGQAPSTKQEDMEGNTQKLIETLRDEYARITDAYINKEYNYSLGSSVKKKKKEDENVEVKVVKVSPNASIKTIIKVMTEDKDSGIVQIKNNLDYELIGSYVDLCETEERMLKILRSEVQKHPMWDLFFKDVSGCGEKMAAVCISNINIHMARHASSVVRYAGLDVVDLVKEDENGNTIVVHEGRAAKHAKYNNIEYVDKNGETKTKHGLGYNPELKSKLIGVLADCILKAGLRTSKDEKGNPVLDEDGRKVRTATGYAKVYLDYINRLYNRADCKDHSDAHKHAMAKRYMIKVFLKDMWAVWREYEGYEVSLPYEVDKLGNKPHKYNEGLVAIAERTRKVN